jgi:uncharacterized repeat protein (TIGR03803 family)
VYKLDTAGHETVLYNFCSLPACADGYSPWSGVIRDAAGSLYGTTTTSGGLGGDWGVVYKLNTAGQQTVLYRFTGGVDGGNPYAGVTRDLAGNLYGTTLDGVIYKLDTAGYETVLYSLGGESLTGVIRDSAGNLFGTANGGGASGHGTVYKLDPAGRLTVLHSFAGGADGAYPDAGVIRDSSGSLYGTTNEGGPGSVGVVFTLDTAGHETVRYGFPGVTGGVSPEAGVIRDSAGALYGTTVDGGAAYAGVVYSVDPAGHETVLHSFTGGADGGYPYAGVIRESAGNLYGTTYAGGRGYGTVYKLDSANNEAVLYSFASGPYDGGGPFSGVIRDEAGNLYGTTSNGGTSGYGVVYKLDKSGQETVLYRFAGGADGGHPTTGVIRDSSGNLYGITNNGGLANAGVVYKLNTESYKAVLYGFTGGADGSGPNSVVRDSDGNLYGTTAGGGTAGWGVVYKLDTAGNETVLYTFTGGPDGGGPISVIRDPAGVFYGTTSVGGAAGLGVVFKLDTTGRQTVLHSFTGGPTAATPTQGLSAARQATSTGPHSRAAHRTREWFSSSGRRKGDVFAQVGTRHAGSVRYDSRPIWVRRYRSAFRVSPNSRAAWLLFPSARRSASRIRSCSYWSSVKPSGRNGSA